jgi:toluene monooxygenase system protein E
MNEQRTFWHLAHLKRKPTDYDIVTSRLLYYTDRGFEVKVPFSAWHERFVKRSALALGDWERFHDPRETTYTRYTELQKTKETFVDELLKSIDETGYDARLTPAWVHVLSRTIGPLRYPIHGLQMVAGYVGHMAPSGRLVIACAFQAADEMRRIQRLAYRTCQLRARDPEFAMKSRSDWEGDELWQPLRRAVERLLVTYDWGEAFTALNLVLKPAFDELFMRRFAELARASGDDLLSGVLFSLNEDCRWHRDWASALVRLLVEERAANRAALQGWVAKWDPVVASALRAFAPIFESSPVPLSFGDVWSQVEARMRQDRVAMGLTEAVP